MRITALVCAAALSLFAAQGALAFDAAAPDASTGAATMPHVAPGSEDAGERSARSLECSQKADAQDLHGKPRKHFMRDCKHGA
ncbi:MAG TPA: PsiF family protein [Roseiarcus sp.]|nr:PsiF family protein [Roseiarcus sp.]